jgi:hypothetical protein
MNASNHFLANLFPEDQLGPILADPGEVANRIIGRILIIPPEQTMLLTLWGIKICIIGFIYRLTLVITPFQYDFAAHCYGKENKCPKAT